MTEIEREIIKYYQECIEKKWWWEDDGPWPKVLPFPDPSPFVCATAFKDGTVTVKMRQAINFAIGGGRMTSKKNVQEYTEGYKGSGVSADVKKPDVLTRYLKNNGVGGVDVLELRDALEGLYNAVNARFSSPSHEKIIAIAAAHGVEYTGPLVYESMNIVEDVLRKTKCLAKE